MATNVDPAELLAVTNRCKELFGDVSSLDAPAGYPHGLALCLIDSVQSAGVKYATVIGVVNRYRAYRASQSGDGDKDGLSQLLTTFDNLGLEEWMQRIGTRNRTPARPGAPFKAHAIRQTAQRLHAAGVDTTADLRAATNSLEQLQAIHDQWIGVVGQTSGVTWHYFLMLAGVPGIKPDRMIVRFIADSLGRSPRTVAAEHARQLLIRTAKSLNASPTALDHAVWKYQRRANHNRI